MITNLKLTTEDYIKMLYDLESGLINSPYILQHDIRREGDMSLCIFARFKSAIDADNIRQLMAQACKLGELAVQVQRFKGARITFKDETDCVLESVIVA